VYPGAVEVCDGIDNDCDGDVDIDAAAPPTWYADSDGDTWGDPTAPALGCEPPDGHVADLTDCDDTDAAVHPGAEEVCDGIDNDCDGLADIGAVDAPTWYEDADSDGYGDPTSVVQACEQPDGYVDNPADCADDDPFTYPGAPERCNGFDDDCNGETDYDAAGEVDADADGWLSCDDCDDSDPMVGPFGCD